MRIFNKSELRYSRVFFDKRPPRFMYYLFLSTLAIVLVAFYIMSILPKNYIVRSEGSVVISGTEYISANKTGTIKSIEKKEGEDVKEGDLLLTLSNGEEGLEKEPLNLQLETLLKQEEIFKKYEKSLQDKVNHLKNEGDEQKYYGKVEYYLAQLKSESHSEYSSGQKIQDVSSQYSAVEAEKASLITNLEALQGKKLEFENELSSLDAIPVDPTSPNFNDLKNKALQINNELENVKMQIDSLNSAILGKDSELEVIRSNIKELERAQGDPSSPAYNTYTQLISELGEERAVNNKSISEIKASIKVLEGQEKNYSLYATSNGTLHYLSLLKVGMSVQQTQVVAEVADENSKKEVYVEAYVEAEDISRVSKGLRVDVAVPGVSIQKFGTLKGVVSHIDSGTIAKDMDGKQASFYKVRIDLEKGLTLKSNVGETVTIEKSMPVEARIVYDKETYLNWMLDMLNFSNN